jgi:hypothetical protein
MDNGHRGAPRGQDINSKIRSDGPIDYFVQYDSDIPVNIVVQWLEDKKIPKRIKHPTRSIDANGNQVMEFYADVLAPTNNPYGIYDIEVCLYAYDFIKRPMFLVSYKIRFNDNTTKYYLNNIDKTKYELISN